MTTADHGGREGGAIQWRPVSEYTLDMFRVLVWLEWPVYSRDAGSLVADGGWQPAYAIQITSGGICWVDAQRCEPIETTGRRVTHFCLPRKPA